MNRTSLALGAVALTLMASAIQAGTCRVIHWKPDAIITINSALNLGTRVELPADNVTDPVRSSDLWDAEGAANQIMIKPNSREPEGRTAVVRAWTTDGNAYDIVATRTDNTSRNDVCVKIQADGMFFTDGARSALNAQSSLRAHGGAASGLQLQQLEGRQRF
ncbi:MAG TPA: hypothetical protein ENI17_02650 [Pseudomonas xinjiangensis]|uniref:Uncharacterized protein n=2 Tax=root TaxID=1 RepID=A0A7V1BRI6_9GAMM|nr:hypothetical protein [Halopseudomonas xinjiangensis]HEC46509.1 hypothetical protein [Halopseudomonas xinjiangensis]